MAGLSQTEQSLVFRPCFNGSADGLYLCVTVTVKNAGLSRVRLNNNMKAVRILGTVGAASGDAGEADWERITTLRILGQHEWLEAQETVTDTVVYRLPTSGQSAPRYRLYQIEAIVGARPRLLTRKRVQWQARTVAFLPPNYFDNFRNFSASANSARAGI